MLESSKAFSGFAVKDLDAARTFYADTLGLDVTEENGMLTLHLAGDRPVLVYPKPDHTPASFTILNLAVEDIDAAVDDLNAKGVVTKIYDDDDLHTDEKGIARGRAANRGPDIAWFRDPAGNVMSVLAG